MSITTIDSLAGGMETLSRLIASCGEVDWEVVDLLPKPWPPHERALTHKCRSWFSTAWAFKSDRSAALFTYTYSLPRSYCNETEADWLCWNASDFPSTCVIPHRETLSSSMVAVSLSLWAWSVQRCVSNKRSVRLFRPSFPPPLWVFVTFLSVFAARVAAAGVFVSFWGACCWYSWCLDTRRRLFLVSWHFGCFDSRRPRCIALFTVVSSFHPPPPPHFLPSPPSFCSSHFFQTSSSSSSSCLLLILYNSLFFLSVFSSLLSLPHLPW